MVWYVYMLHNYEYQYLSVKVDFVSSEAVYIFYICRKISIPESTAMLQTGLKALVATWAPKN